MPLTFGVAAGGLSLPATGAAPAAGFARGAALAQLAETRVPLPDSCRRYRAAAYRLPSAILGLVLLLAAAVVLAVGIVTLGLDAWMLRQGMRFATIGGKGGTSRLSRLRAARWPVFAAVSALFTVSVVLPLARPGFITASILGFAHTVGEFGVVLMIGGNIPDKTRVVSVQIFDHVEAMEYSQAHWLAGAMLVFSFLVLLLLYAGRRGKAGWS